MELNEKLKKARKQGALSELMEKREKMETADYLGKILTVCDVDVVDYDTDDTHCHYGILVVSEFPDNFIMCGKALTEVCEYLISAYEEEKTPDYTIQNFLADNVIQFKAELVKTKKKQNFVNIEII